MDREVSSKESHVEVGSWRSGTLHNGYDLSEVEIDKIPVRFFQSYGLTAKCRRRRQGTTPLANRIDCSRVISAKDQSIFKNMIHSDALFRSIRHWLLTEPLFVIVGTGRSGTGYVSQVLTAAGIRTGHERWWNPAGHRGIRLVGDASWCATFEVDDYRGRIFHQIRDPLETLRSVASVEVAQHRTGNPWYRHRTQFVDMTGDPLVDAVQVVDVWLTKAEEVSEWTWRLEDLDVDLVAEIGRRVGRKVDRVAAAEALRSATRNEKTDEKRTTYEFGWENLPERAESERIREIAQRYGYI